MRQPSAESPGWARPGRYRSYGEIVTGGDGLGPVNLGIAGQSIERVSLDYAVSLLTDGGAEVRIESSFWFRTPTGEVVLVDPEMPGQGVEKFLAMLHQMITEASVVEGTGTLVIEVVNGTRLEVAADESYEAWTFNDTDGLKIVALPGGGIATWGSSA